jgi:hypothetical protein
MEKKIQMGGAFKIKGMVMRFVKSRN